MKQKLLSLVLVLCLMLTLVPTLALAEGKTKANVATQEELATALGDQNITEITITGNIAMSGKWTPANIEAGRDLTINGAGYTISNMVVTDGLLKATDPGQTGNDCDYYAGFIGRNQGTLNIKDLTFDGADVRIDPLSPKDEGNAESKGSKGSSIVSVVLASNMGSAVLENVNVNDSKIQASTKAGILLGFNGKEEAYFEANQCAIINSTVTLIADGWDSEAAFSGVIVGYVSAKWANNVAITGIKLSGNTSTVDASVKWEGYNTETEDIQDGYQITLAVNAAEPYDSWVLTCDTYAIGNSGDVPLFPAEVNGYMYSNVTDAIKAAGEGKTVKLLCDTEEDVVIPVGKNVTLDLNGKTLTSAGGDTITNKGTLTVTGAGTVQCDTAGKSALLNDVGGTAILNGGTFAKNLNVNSNDYYVITNHGAKVEINDGVTVTSTSTHSSAIENGWYTASDNKDTNAYSNMIINGGEVIASGGLYTVKNDDYGVMEINGGTFTNTVAKNGTVLNWNELTITGGTFNAANCSVATMATGDSTPTYAYEKGKTTISGGYFIGGLGVGENVDKAITVQVSGGYFSHNIKLSYLANGKVAVPSDKSGYNYMIADMATNVGTATKDPAVKAADGIDQSVVEQVKKTGADGLTPVLNGVANLIAQNDSVHAKAAEALEGINTTNETVSVVVRSFMDIAITDYKADADDKKVLTLDITPKYELVATTAKKAADGTYTLNESGVDKNAAVIPGTETVLTDVTVPVTVTVPVPEGFLTSDDAGKIFVKHVKTNGATYYYLAQLIMDDTDTTKVVAIRFTTTHGFSPFTIQQDERTGKINFPAPIGEKEYTAANVGDTLPVPPVPAGKTFGGWTVEGSNYTTLTDDLLTKLSEDADKTLDATAYFYTPSYGGATTYTVKLPGTLTGGTMKADRTNASSGSTVTLTATPADGYVLDELTVTDKNGKELKLTNKGNGKYSFTMPASNVTVTASFKNADAWESPFTDVRSGDWFYDGVAYAYQQGMMNGVSAASFDPYGATTRGMIVTILYRLEGSPAVSGSAFDDVSGDAYYADAVTWASKNGIVTGFGDGSFGPDQAITREQLAAILYRYAAMKGYAVTDRADLSGFADAGSVSDYAKEAMAWANAAGLINGVTGTALDPQGGALRCQVAVILARFCQSFIK